MMKVPEQYRIKTGEMASTSDLGNNGAFKIPRFGFANLFVVASDGHDWEHVSVSVEGARRCPTWEEMCFVKELFWSIDDTVIQFHPPESEYVNNHKFCLHMWKPPYALSLPASWMVGLKILNQSRAVSA